MHFAQQRFVSVALGKYVGGWLLSLSCVQYPTPLNLCQPFQQLIYRGSTLALGIVGSHLMFHHVYFPSLPNHTLASRRPIGNFGRRVAMILKVELETWGSSPWGNCISRMISSTILISAAIPSFRCNLLIMANPKLPQSSPPDISKTKVETVESIHKPSPRIHGKDKAAELLAANERIVVTEAENKRVLKKIDLIILPILLSVYFLQSLDKVGLFRRHSLTSSDLL